MVAELLWRCPRCGTSRSLRRRLLGGWRCKTCGTLWVRSGEGCLTARFLEGTETRPAWEWYEMIRSGLRLSDSLGAEDEGEAWCRESGPAVLRLGVARRWVRGPMGIQGSVDRAYRLGRGRLGLSKQEVVFRWGRGGERVLGLDRLTAVTTTSHALELKGRGEPVWLVNFRRESCREWEELIRLALQRWYGGQGFQILEFQPYLRAAPVG